MTDAALADDRTTFDDAHPALAVEMVDDEGEAVRIPEERLPRLLGWSVLLRPYQPPKQTKKGVWLPDQVTDANEHLTYAFQVVRVGPLAFTHPRLRGGMRTGRRREETDDATGETWWETSETVDFAEGVEPPREGDWVIVRRYAGIQLQLEGVTFKICNDDDIIAVIDSPRGWKAYV